MEYIANEKGGNIRMKKLIATVLLTLSVSVVSAMDWARYEMMCYFNGKEPDYDEYVWLCTEGATDWGYDEEDLIKLIESEEVSETE